MSTATLDRSLIERLVRDAIRQQGANGHAPAAANGAASPKDPSGWSSTSPRGTPT